MVDKIGMSDPGRLVFIRRQRARRVAEAGDKEGVIIISRDGLISLVAFGDGTPFSGAVESEAAPRAVTDPRARRSTIVAVPNSLVLRITVSLRIF